MCLSKIVAFSIILSTLIQPLGLVSVARAETVEMEYTDPDHLHAPKIVNGVGYQYDANGNLINDGERKIDWNQDNLPTRIEKDGQVVEFFYDANGRRIVKKSGGDKTVYVNQYYQPFADAQGKLSTTKYYFANGRAAVRNTPSGGESTLTFLYQDHLGSTVLVTDTNSQPLSNPLSYFPYGNHLTMQPFSHSSYLFTGQELDPESDLYNYNARLYNPKTGAFISADSVGGGNRYAYAENNPMIFTDPSGNQAIGQAFYWLTKIIAGAGRVGTSVFSGTFWAGATTWLTGVYAEAVTTYQKETGMIINPIAAATSTGYYNVAGCDSWGACPINEEAYNNQMRTAAILQGVGKEVAVGSANLYLGSALVRAFGETVHPGPIDREKTLKMADEIIREYNLKVKFDETGGVPFGAGATHSYDPETGVSTIVGSIRPVATIHELGHAVETQAWGTLHGLSVEAMPTERWYTEGLNLAIEQEVGADAFASREMFKRGEWFYSLYHDLRATTDPIAYSLMSFYRYHDYWTRTIGGPR